MMLQRIGHIGGPGCTICNPPDRKVEVDKDDALSKALEAAFKELKEKEQSNDKGNFYY